MSFLSRRRHSPLAHRLSATCRLSPIRRSWSASTVVRPVPSRHLSPISALSDGKTMIRLFRTLAIATAVASFFTSNHAAAQLLPPLKKAARVKIIKAPELEIAVDHLTIIRWTTTNPGGSDVHYGIVHYGTDPQDLSQTAKSPVRLNQGHPYTTFRVRMEGLKPRTTYYYRVTSEESNGKNDGVTSAVKKFTTPGPGERIVAYPKSD